MKKFLITLIFYIACFSSSKGQNASIQSEEANLIVDNLNKTFVDLVKNSDKNCVEEKVEDLSDEIDEISKMPQVRYKTVLAMIKCTPDSFFEILFEKMLKKVKNQIFAENLDCFRVPFIQLENREEFSEYLGDFEMTETTGKKCSQAFDGNEENLKNAFEKLYFLQLFSFIGSGGYRAEIAKMIILSNGNFTKEFIQQETNKMLKQIKEKFENELKKNPEKANENFFNYVN